MPTFPNATHSLCPTCGSCNVRAIPDVQPQVLNCHCIDCNEIWLCAEPAPVCS
jgi:hypothetical protein